MDALGESWVGRAAAPPFAARPRPFAARLSAPAGRATPPHAAARPSLTRQPAAARHPQGAVPRSCSGPPSSTVPRPLLQRSAHPLLQRSVLSAEPREKKTLDFGNHARMYAAARLRSRVHLLVTPQFHLLCGVTMRDTRLWRLARSIKLRTSARSCRNPPFFVPSPVRGRGGVAAGAAGWLPGRGGVAAGARRGSCRGAVG